jgi:hypothetical protein
LFDDFPWPYAAIGQIAAFVEHCHGRAADLAAWRKIVSRAFRAFWSALHDRTPFLTEQVA